MAAASEVSKSPEVPEVSEDTEKCPICLEELEDPCIVDECKHAFCRACIYDWAALTMSCPLCRGAVDFTKFTGVIGPDGHERVKCRLYGCYASILYKNLGKHVKRCHPIFKCDACGHNERVKSQMFLHEERNCEYRVLMCPAPDCREGVRACDYTDDPRAIFVHHQCSGVWVCEKHAFYSFSAEEHGRHLGNEH